MSDDLLDTRLTEHRNPNTSSIDRAEALEIVDLINAEDRKVPDAVAAEREAIARAIEMVVDGLRAGGRLIYVGAGTSGRLGVLDAAECPPTFGTDPELVEGIIAGGYMALVRSQEGIEDDTEAAVDAIDDRAVGAEDFVLGIAASSTTPFVRAALARARARGAHTGFLCCTEPGQEMRQAVDVCIVPLVGPEVVAGSTRMKAGTATKLVLNTITTGAMIRLGKVYGNLMVDLQAKSDKLVDRGERIVMATGGVSREEARAAIAEAGGSVKTAVVMTSAGVGRELAELMLAESGGFVASALDRGRKAGKPSDPCSIYPPEPPDESTAARLIDALRSLPRRVSETVASAPDAALARRPKSRTWCAKEQIEHLIAVDAVMARRLRRMLEEEEPSLPNWDETVENERVFESGVREMPTRVLLRRLADGRTALMVHVQAAPLDELSRAGRHETYGRVTAYQLLRHLAWHDDHHVQAIRRLLAE